MWQGRRELNSQHPVLETGALPIELRPYIYEKSKVRYGSKSINIYLIYLSVIISVLAYISL